MCREPNFDQLKLMMELREGDKVKLSSGEIAEFVRGKQKKFIGIMNGARYDIPFSLLDSLVEKADYQQKKEESLNLVSQLKKGDYFYINKNGRAVTFKFDRIEGNKIIGINPIDNTSGRIDMSFQIGLLK